jgi:hypothetical protein
MKNSIEQFSHEEMQQRRSLQKELYAILSELRSALETKKYEDAIFLNLHGARTLDTMVERGLALEEEATMLYTLRQNVTNIMRLQSRMQ